ncbi:quinone oxidoreductase family protein [Agrobacterium sp. NPDC089420]|uniref:quinone oxidoreductase family protein n=1 Tax=Agrobacterium sp. NPDC089420 TaxID=3363918 RepID=UPI00384EC292
MAIAVKIDQVGDVGVMKLCDLVRSAPGPGEVWIEHEAIGVNFLDVMQRKGTAPLATPNGLGLEAAGRVTEVGPHVDSVAVGDRVAYILGPIGAYASGRVYPANRLVKLPSWLEYDEAAAVLFKAVTAQYLLKSTYPVREGNVVLIYGAAGGVGQLLASWAKALGAFVVGVVSKEASVERAKTAGCDEVLIWGNDLPQRLQKAAGGSKADVVYDGIGHDTFAASLDSLKTRGMLVSIGASSGAPPAVEMGTLNVKGSLFVTRPGLAAHVTDIGEYQDRVRDVFEAIKNGILKPNVSRVIGLSDVHEAHRLLENGEARGALILKP